MAEKKQDALLNSPFKKREHEWWGTDGKTFVVRDLSMRSNKNRAERSDKNPGSRYFYIETSNWSVFEDGFRDVIDLRGYDFIPKFLAENNANLPKEFESTLKSVQKEFAQRWGEFDERILEKAHALHREQRGFDMIYPSFVARKDSKRKRRLTHCWSCKHDLDSIVDVSCVECSWLLCSCGSCGCGYG